MTVEFEISKLYNGQPSNLAQPIILSLTIQDRKCIISITAPYHGDPAPNGAPGRCWKLWEHEVVEIFLVDKKGHYIEAEFGPHGHYLLLLLKGPRDIAKDDLKMKYSAKIDRNRWSANAEFDLDEIERIDRVNCFAIYGLNEKRRYLAWTSVPGKKPNFHQPHVFKHLH